MNVIRHKALLVVALAIGFFVAAYMTSGMWWPQQRSAATDPSTTAVSDASTSTNKVIVSDQAQRNLGLASKPVQATTFWKTITVPGMIVDRPGYSDREVAAPVAGTITQLFHVPGDPVHVDLVRAGGITQWLKVAGMAEAFNLPIVSHLVPEIQVHLVSAVPNGLTVEYFPWTNRLWQEMPRQEGGMIVVPDRPGLGLAFDQQALERYGVG